MSDVAMFTALQKHLECPVCFEPFDSVIQCRKGHSVCVTCSKSLYRCPICREVVSGTRNFTLEGVMRLLKDVKLNMQRQPALPSKTTRTPPPLFACRATNCGILLQHSQFYVHLRNAHKNVFYEYKFSFDEPMKTFQLHYQISTDQNRFIYINLIKSGLFAVIVRIQNTRRKRQRHIYIWVQRVCSDYEARTFSCKLNIVSNHLSAEYSDYVHGEESTEEGIMSQKTCLFVKVPSHLLRFKIELDIFKTTLGLRNPRTTETECIE